MNGQEMTVAIRKYLKKRYSFQIINKLKAGKQFVVERGTLKEVLPGVGEEIIELLLEQLYEDGIVIKDDGHTVAFSENFVFG